MPAVIADPRPRRLVPLTWGTFVLLGWTSVLVPALLRQIEARFGVDDAAVGLYYFVYAASYASASFAGGLLSERFGRSVVLPATATLLGLGLVATGLAPTWALFVAAAVPLGAGAGVIDGGINGLALALADEARGRALNLLHLFFAIGATAAPLVVGRLVLAGVPTPTVFVATGIAAFVIAATLRATAMPSGLRREADRVSASEATSGAPSLVRPLILLAIAIGCFVATEVGVSNWVIRFLAGYPETIGSTALSAFWAGLALGRLTGARYGDRFDHARFAAVASVVTGIAVIVAVTAPVPELAIGAFAVAGFACGPIFPMIMALGGDLYPDRLAATTGTLTGAAVVGGMLYPPLIGLMSAGFGLATGLLGAALLSFACAGAILAAARSRDRRIAPGSLEPAIASPEGSEPPAY